MSRSHAKGESAARRIRIVVLTAPSGSGKTTIARRLLEAFPAMQFSVSATTRKRRDSEADGEDYFFMTVDDFEREIADGAFVEYEEVYPEVYYGTLHREIERISRTGAALLDIDVKGALNVKREYGDDALTIFIAPPSLDVLARRLRDRGTETDDSLAARLERAKVEMSYAHHFDEVVVNDSLEEAVVETIRIVGPFVGTAATPS